MEPADAGPQLRAIIAALADLPADSPTVRELTRAVRGLVEAGTDVLGHGHGTVELEFSRGQYVRPHVHKRYPVDSRP